eukprot:gene11020-12184_t
MASAASALQAIERLLDGKTTLRTKRVTHKNIICVGTELLEHIQKLMTEDKEKAISQAVEECEKRAALKLKSQIDLIEQILTHERQKQIKELKKVHKLNIAEVKRNCELEEEQRAAETYKRFQIEKEKAVEETIAKAIAERESQIKEALERIKDQLLEEARIDKQKAINEQLKIAAEKALKAQQLAIAKAEMELNLMKQKEIQNLVDDYTNEINDLEQRLKYTQNMFDIEKRRKEDIQQDFMDLKEDYKRFQNYTDKYHSDYLLP